MNKNGSTFRHGHKTRGSKTPEYTSWLGMKRRCFVPHGADYHLYGGRGITVCDRWNDDFVNFLEDMGRRPKGHSLDRINPNGNYEPSNCRWASVDEQCNNKRTSLFVEAYGEVRTITQWAKHLNIKYNRMYHWVVKRQMPLEVYMAS